jgi:hypothetical protein
MLVVSESPHSAIGKEQYTVVHTSTNSDAPEASEIWYCTPTTPRTSKGSHTTILQTQKAVKATSCEVSTPKTIHVENWWLSLGWPDTTLALGVISTRSHAAIFQEKETVIHASA